MRILKIAKLAYPDEMLVFKTGAVEVFGPEFVHSFQLRYEDGAKPSELARSANEKHKMYQIHKMIASYMRGFIPEEHAPRPSDLHPDIGDYVLHHFNGCTLNDFCDETHASRGRVQYGLERVRNKALHEKEYATYVMQLFRQSNAN